MAESKVVSFIKQTRKRMRSFPMGRSVCRAFEAGSALSYSASGHLSFAMLSESRGICVSCVFWGLHSSEGRAFAAAAAGAAARGGVGADPRVQDETSPAVRSKRSRTGRCAVLWAAALTKQPKLGDSSTVWLTQLPPSEILVFFQGWL